jgi:hypothetical protein
VSTLILELSQRILTQPMLRNKRRVKDFNTIVKAIKDFNTIELKKKDLNTISTTPHLSI